MKLIIFLVMVILSPWMWMLLLNFEAFKLKDTDMYNLNSQTRVYEINVIRSECAEYLGIVCKLVFNKFVWNGREAMSRILETYDPSFLWIQGDLDPSRSSRFGGAILASYAMLAVGRFLISKKKITLFLLLVIMSLPTIFVENHYHTTPRIPVLLLITFLSSSGLIELLKVKKYYVLKVLLMLVFLIEILFFTHNFVYHFINL